MIRLLLHSLLFGSLFFGCAPPPTPLPTEAASTELMVYRDALPPLYRRLYDYAFLPEIQDKEQRVRLTIWLYYMGFNRYQLDLLQELWEKTQRERESVQGKHAEIVTVHEPKVGEAYDKIWAALSTGNVNEIELARLSEGLEEIRVREDELLEIRARSIRALLEAQSVFLRTLTPEQETYFSDAIFLLRHRLDPYANPGDFNTLVGSIYVAGEFGNLTRPTFEPSEDHLNLGGLWSPRPDELTGPYFPDARREVILYLVMLEPTLPEAITVARQLRSSAATETEAPAAGSPLPVAQPGTLIPVTEKPEEPPPPPPPPAENDPGAPPPPDADAGAPPPATPPEIPTPPTAPAENAPSAPSPTPDPAAPQ